MTTSQFSITRELKGYVGFEKVYQGLPGNIPIPLTPYADGLDPQAAEQLARIKEAIRANGGSTPVNTSGNGIHPFLIGALPTPMGATANIWIPQCEQGEQTETSGYSWIVVWRIRSPQVNQQGGTRPFHSAFSAPGEDDDGSNDTSLGAPVWTGNAAKRLIIPAAVEVLRYVQPQPIIPGSPALEALWWDTQRVVTTQAQSFGTFPGPVQGSTADAQGNQGLIPNPGPGLPLTALHACYPRMCLGDEMFMLVSKRYTGEAPPDWDFTLTGEDFTLATVLGRGYPSGTIGNVKYNPLVGAGILVTTGVAP